uniref:CCHC-type domain-containing protein n=1 Tax=Tanacetum cinerariifolium TaxID=118510 RepID=A0A6L2KN24_TANCI|nr:hypothetical protein [Tanacetum cinerariifolium]
MSFDDLYNNFKIVEQEVKRTITSSPSSGSQNMAFLLTPGSTNEVDTATIQVSIFSTPVNTISGHDNTANSSDATVQLALLSMRARRYFQRNSKKITINGSDNASYDMTKVECFNCHKIGHFAREYRSPRSQESRPRSQDSSRKTVIVEDTSSKTMVVINGAGFDWSYMADDEVPNNMTLMAFVRLKETSPFSQTIKNMMEDFITFAGSSKGGKITGLKIHSDVGQEGKEKVSDQEYILLLVLNTSSDVPSSNEEVVSSPKDNAGKKSNIEPTCVEGGKIDDLGCLDQQMKSTDDSKNTNNFNTASDKDGTFQRTYGEWNFSTPITVIDVGYSFSHLVALDDFSKCQTWKTLESLMMLMMIEMRV